MLLVSYLAPFCKDCQGFQRRRKARKEKERGKERPTERRKHGRMNSGNKERTIERSSPAAMSPTKEHKLKVEHNLNSHVPFGKSGNIKCY